MGFFGTSSGGWRVYFTKHEHWKGIDDLVFVLGRKRGHDINLEVGRRLFVIVLFVYYFELTFITV